MNRSSKPVAASELVARRRTDPSYEGPDNSPAVVAVDLATQAVIDDLFLRLRGACGAWRQSWPTEAVMNASKLEWLGEFMRSGITRMEQIDHGMRVVSASKSAFVPAPGVFVSWCFAPEGLGLPSVESAYAQALRNCHPAMRNCSKWYHPAVYHATAAAGFHSLPLLSRELGLASFEKHYLNQCRRIWKGEQLEAVPAAELPSPEPKMTPDVGNKALAELRARRAGGSR
ncbi:replication P family protein [Pseudomonas sp. MAFF 730085]|uniref:Replication P family protein n=1 Tax=Pseudomonas kitaguniensis TaxID=2607908 RepID=A0A5N7JQX2_9PSED|nr:replication protein P [Pseudomonas kitaguniensis]MPQ83788.1 replication P family protein [Pseudomonas kitaguniensis]